MIQSLMEQIKALQAQLIHLQNDSDTPSRWCYDFNHNLRIGDKGKEIIALHKALENDGFGPFDRGGDNFNAFEVFTEETASAVVGFQEKYKDEILIPNNLKYGTGFVGKSTRAKLNQLYGCEGKPIIINTYSSSSIGSINIKYLSPSSGPVGAKVIITGTGFLESNTIYFGGERVSVKPISVENNINDDKGIIFIVPTTIDPYIRCNVAPCPQPPSRVVTPGVYPVYVSNANGTSNKVDFTVTSKNSSSSSSSSSSISSYNLSITSIDQTSGKADGKTAVTITGTGFRPTASVFFSTPGMATIKPWIVSNDGTSLIFILPNDTQTFTPGTYNVKVANNDGTPYSNSVLFTVTATNP